MMLADPVARVYAEALFAIARERKLVVETGEELNVFLELLRADDSIAQFLASPVLDAADKVGSLGRALDGKMSETVANFLCLLVAKRRISSLSAVGDAYQSLADEYAQRTRVSVRSAEPLADSARNEIEAMLRSTINKEIVLDATVEPAILGGAIITVGDRVYDGSIRGRLNQFRKQIVRSGGYEIKG